MKLFTSSLLLSLVFAACQTTEVENSSAPPSGKPSTSPSSNIRTNPSTPPIKRGIITQMPLEQFFVLRSEGKTLTIDVRRPVMFALGHINGAINLPLTSFDKTFPKHRARLDQARETGQVIVLYCDGENCPDAHTTAKALADRGYSTSIYRGGWSEWTEIGMD